MSTITSYKNCGYLDPAAPSQARIEAWRDTTVL